MCVCCQGTAQKGAERLSPLRFVVRSLHARRKFYRVVPVNDFAGTISRSGTVAFVASIRPIRSVKSEKLPALGRRFKNRENFNTRKTGIWQSRNIYIPLRLRMHVKREGTGGRHCEISRVRED